MSGSKAIGPLTGQSGFVTLTIVVAILAVSGLMLLAAYEQSLAALLRYFPA